MAESSSDSSEAQARRALEFAEQRFLSGDVAGARHCAAYALGLAPGLPAAEQALAAYDVHAAAAPVGGCGPGLGARPTTNWYAVLGLPNPRPVRQPSADDPDVVTHDAVKRQHRRLCLLVHPDKNPSAAADGAFKLVQAAYDALSAIHPPTPAAAADLRPTRDDEARRRFWQTAAQDDVAPPPAWWPKQPPIARPPPRR